MPVIDRQLHGVAPGFVNPKARRGRGRPAQRRRTGGRFAHEHPTEREQVAIGIGRGRAIEVHGRSNGQGLRWASIRHGRVIHRRARGGIIDNAVTVVIGLIAADLRALDAKADAARMPAGVGSVNDRDARGCAAGYQEHDMVAIGTEHLGDKAADHLLLAVLGAADVNDDVLRAKAIAGNRHLAAGPRTGGIDGEDAGGIGGRGRLLPDPLGQRGLQRRKPRQRHRQLPAVVPTQFLHRPALDRHQDNHTLCD